MALIEVLDAMPEDYARRNEVIELLQKDLDAVIKWQDKKTGVWYQVMDSPNREGNYLESTASAMFAYGLLKAANKGYLGKRYQGIQRNHPELYPRECRQDHFSDQLLFCCRPRPGSNNGSNSSNEESKSKGFCK